MGFAAASQIGRDYFKSEAELSIELVQWISDA
jgi:hypothetical protein